METKMTSRDFFTAIVADETISADLRDYATEQIAKLDAKNAKRSSKPSKTQVANEPIKTAIIEYLSANGQSVSSEIATVLSTEESPVTTQKVSALCRQLVADGLLSVADVKIPKKGAVKAYSVVSE